MVFILIIIIIINIIIIIIIIIIIAIIIIIIAWPRDAARSQASIASAAVGRTSRGMLIETTPPVRPNPGTGFMGA